MNIYVGNLPPEVTDQQLKETFDPFGEVISVNIVRDRDTGKSHGFGFVQIPDAERAKAAITAMNDNDCLGPKLKVEAGNPRPTRRSNDSMDSRGDRRGGGRGRGGRGRRD